MENHQRFFESIEPKVGDRERKKERERDKEWERDRDMDRDRNKEIRVIGGEGGGDLNWEKEGNHSIEYRVSKNIK